MSRAGRGWGDPEVPVLRVSAGAQPESVPVGMDAGPARGVLVGGMRTLQCVLLPLRAQAHWPLRLGRVGRQVLGRKGWHAAAAVGELAG